MRIFHTRLDHNPARCWIIHIMQRYKFIHSDFLKSQLDDCAIGLCRITQIPVFFIDYIADSPRFQVQPNLMQVNSPNEFAAFLHFYSPAPQRIGQIKESYIIACFFQAFVSLKGIASIFLIRSVLKHRWGIFQGHWTQDQPLSFQSGMTGQFDINIFHQDLLFFLNRIAQFTDESKPLRFFLDF